MFIDPDTAPTIGNALPALRAEAPIALLDTTLDTTRLVGIVPAIEGIAGALGRRTRISVDAADSLARDLIRDLAALRPQGDRGHELVVEQLIFAVCTLVGIGLADRGELVRPWEWTVRAIGDQDGDRWLRRNYRVAF